MITTVGLSRKFAHGEDQHAHRSIGMDNVIRSRLRVLKAMAFVMGIVSYIADYESIENVRRKDIQTQVSYIILR